MFAEFERKIICSGRLKMLYTEYYGIRVFGSHFTFEVNGSFETH